MALMMERWSSSSSAGVSSSSRFASSSRQLSPLSSLPSESEEPASPGFGIPSFFSI